MRTTAFRIATVTLETIERKRCSLGYAFQRTLSKTKEIPVVDLKTAYAYAEKALRYFAEADLVMKKFSLTNIPPRRRAAFRVAYGLIRSGELTINAVRLVKGGLLSSRMLAALKSSVSIVEEEILSLSNVEKLAVKYATPPWIVQELISRLGPSECERALKSMWRGYTWLRVNTVKISIDKAIRKLRRAGIELREDPDYPYMLEVTRGDRVTLSRLDLLNNGCVFVQDKGSAAVVEALEPEEGELVLDMAAAPGMKTTLIAQKTRCRALIVAADISRSRTREMKIILRRAGTEECVEIAVADSRRLSLARQADRVLIDAPCTNSGAIGSDPGLRLALWSKPDVGKYYALQEELLKCALRCVKPGGCVVYATCSFLADEGERHFEGYGNGAKLIEPNIHASPGYKAFKCSRYTRRLYPHIHRTIGFFIAKLVKT